MAASMGIIGLTETWLDPDFDIGTLLPQNFQTYRQDKVNRVGGGVLLLVRNDIKQSSGETFLSDKVQAVEAKLSSSTWTGSVVLVYRSPSCTSAEADDLIEWIKGIIRTAGGILLMGDFNIPEINWRHESTSSETFGESFLKLLNDCGLYQHVQEPTRFRDGQHPSLLDLVITRYEKEVSGLKLTHPLGKSDHMCISFQLGVECIRRNSSFMRRYHSIDILRLRNLASSLVWHHDDKLSLEGNWKTLKDNILLLTDLVAPLRACKRQSKKPWIKSRALKALRKKRFAFCNYKNDPSFYNWRQYSRMRSEANKTLRSCRLDYEEKVAKSAKSNPKAYYKCVQSKKSLKKEIIAIEAHDGISIRDAGGIANELV